MKIRSLIIDIIGLVVVCVGVLGEKGASADQGKPPYLIGVYSGLGGTQDAQGAELIRQLAQIFDKKLGIRSRARLYTSQDLFIQDVLKKQLDMVFTTRWDLLFGSLKEAGYTPLVTLQAYGLTHSPNCLYVQKSSPHKKWQDLKGKKVTTYNSMTEFMQLRYLLKIPLESYFDPLEPFQNSMSGVLGLSLGSSEGTYVNEGTVRHMARTNPGIVEGLRKLVCNQAAPFPPLSRSPLLHPKESEMVINILLNAHNNPEFAVFKPLLKRMEASFVKVDWKDYSYLEMVRQNGKQGGWENEWKVWMSHHGVHP